MESSLFSPSLGLLIVAGVVILGGGTLILAISRLSQQADRDSITRLDTLITDAVAQRLADVLKEPLDTIKAQLTNPSPDLHLVERYHELIDEVSVRIERKGSHVVAQLHIRGKAAFERSYPLQFDDLPTPARQAIMRGQEPLIYPWQPPFHKS